MRGFDDTVRPEPVLRLASLAQNRRETAVHSELVEESWFGCLTMSGVKVDV
jgi:hypothetical protein